MQLTLETPKAFDLNVEDNVQLQNVQLQEPVPHCVAAANGSWCDLNTGEEKTGEEEVEEEFDEEDFDDDFDDDFEEEEDDGYGDFDDTIDPFATDEDSKEAEEDEEDVEFNE